MLDKECQCNILWDLCQKKHRRINFKTNANPSILFDFINQHFSKYELLDIINVNETRSVLVYKIDENNYGVIDYEEMRLTNGVTFVNYIEASKLKKRTYILINGELLYEHMLKLAKDKKIKTFNDNVYDFEPLTDITLELEENLRCL